MSQRFSVKQFGTVVKALDESRVKVVNLTRRIRLARASAALIGWKVGAQDQVDRLLDLRKPLSRRTKRPR